MIHLPENSEQVSQEVALSPSIDPFHLSMALLDLQQIQSDPDLAAYYDAVPGTPEMRQLTLILERIKGLRTEIELAEVQIGMFIVVGTTLQLHRLVDPEYTTMRQLLIDNGYDNKLLTRSITRYQVLQFADKYGCTKEQIEQANHEQLVEIQALSNRAAVQYDHIVGDMITSDGRHQSALSKEEVQRYYDEAEDQFTDTIRQEIASILSTEHPSLYQPEPAGGHYDPPGKKIQWIVKEPEYHIESGAFRARSIDGFIAPDQFSAMKRSSIDLAFQIGDELLSMAQYAQRLEELSYEA